MLPLEQKTYLRNPFFRYRPTIHTFYAFRVYASTYSYKLFAHTENQIETRKKRLTNFPAMLTDNHAYETTVQHDTDAALTLN